MLQFTLSPLISIPENRVATPECQVTRTDNRFSTLTIQLDIGFW